MARTRTTKKLAQRIDLNYFKRSTPFKRAKFWLSVLLPAFAFAWIAWHFLVRDHRVYSSGRLSSAHAVLEKECAACHLEQAGQLSAAATDSACLACHDGPVHHPFVTKQPACTNCHVEHRGRINPSSVSNQGCALCHARLATPLWGHIESFEASHPQFAALKEGLHDPGTIKLNHAIHMKPIRRGPNGPIVNLECGNCHHATAAEADLTYADPKYRAASVSYNESDEVPPMDDGTLSPAKPMNGRELMAPVKFANACASCHLLSFDKHFEEGVPHDEPGVVHTFLLKKFREYITAHPGEIRVKRDPNRDLTGKPLPPEVRILTPAQWVAERATEAEDLLWRKTCKQCHTLNVGASADGLPNIAEAKTTTRWMPHARFDHGAHTGFTCVSCHATALTSMESSDVLLPGIATCRTCHASGPDHAESRCFECHTYHDWSKRKEVKPTFTLPALRTSSH